MSRSQRTTWAIALVLALFNSGIALPQEKKALKEPSPDTVKSFTFKKTTKADKTTPVQLDVHVHFPKGWKKDDKRPAIIFFFGGGFVNGGVDGLRRQAEYFAGRGLVTLRADYRVKDRHGVTPDACVEDAKSAMRWLRQNAAMLGVDPDRIVAAGSSSGGYLAAALSCPGLDAEGEDLKVSTRPNAAILINPFLPFADNKANWKIVPAASLTKETPPTLILFGTKDGLLKGGEQFIAKSKEVGHKAEMYLAEGAGHGFANQPLWRDKVLLRCDEYLGSLGYVTSQD